MDSGLRLRKPELYEYFGIMVLIYCPSENAEKTDEG